MPGLSPTQTEQPGSLAASYRDALEWLVSHNAAARLFDRDPSLWKAEPAHAAVIRNRLGWLDSPAWLQAHFDSATVRTPSQNRPRLRRRRARKSRPRPTR